MKKIVIVDNDFNIQNLARKLSNKDFDIFPIANIEATKPLVKKYNPDYVLLNEELEGSYKLTKWIRRKSKANLFILSKDPDQNEYKKWKCKGVLKHPVTEESLKNLLFSESPFLKDDYKEQLEDRHSIEEIKLKKPVISQYDYNNKFWDEEKNIIGKDFLKRKFDLKNSFLNKDSFKTGNKEVKNKETGYKILVQNVISIYSAQGGVGRTSTAIHLAKLLNKLGVLLIDLNFAEGPSDISLYLQLPKLPHLSKFISNQDSPRKAFNDTIINVKKHNFDIIQTPPTLRQSDQFDATTLMNLVEIAKRRYGIIIADLPDNYDDITLEMLNLSSSVILVATLEIGAAARLKEIYHLLDPKQRIFLLINKYSKKSSVTQRDISEYLDLPIAGVIEDDPGLLRRMEKGNLSFDDNTIFGGALKEITEKILDYNLGQT
ncbi:MAG: AAA family ATPase [Actinomycetota bacterium]